MARPIERPKHHYKPFEFTIDIEEAFNYLDEFKNTPDYPKTFPFYVPNKYKILGEMLESKFGVSMVEARKIVGMWFDRNKNIRTENMKRTIKLTERDLTRIVKRIINEDNEEMESNNTPSVEVNFLDGSTDAIQFSTNPVNDLIELIGNDYAGMYVDEDSGNLIINVVKWPHDLI